MRRVLALASAVASMAREQLDEVAGELRYTERSTGKLGKVYNDAPTHRKRGDVRPVGAQMQLEWEKVRGLMMLVVLGGSLAPPL